MYTEAISLNKYNRKLNAILYSNRAQAHRQLGSDSAALSDCNKSIELDERFTKSYLRRAELKLQKEEFNEAIADYWKIKELDPSTESQMQKNIKNA